MANILKQLLTLRFRPPADGICQATVCATTHVRHLKEPVLPPLDDSEIEEKFSGGTGPGGQKVNKANNRCQLKHLPTGIMASSHDTRSLEQNRTIARKMLQQKLDLHFNKENSYLAQLEKEKRIARAQKNKRSVENLQRKQQFAKELEDEST